MNRISCGKKCSRAAAIILSLLMILTLSAPTALAAAPSNARPVPELSQIREMLEGRSYTEGDAIVVAEKGFDPAAFIKGDSEKLAEAGEESMSLTADAARETDVAVHEVAAERADASRASSFNITKVHSDDLDTADLIAKLYTSPKVISAEPNYLIDASEAYATEGDEENSGQVSNPPFGEHDPDVGDLSSAQWYLGDGGGSNTLEGDGISGVGMAVPGYNGHGGGSPNSSTESTIAVLDSGMDVTHPDLEGQFYTFTAEQQEKYHCGKHGLNVTADPDSDDVGDLTDHVDHGTHVSGIMAANWNGKGVAGVSNGAKLVGVRLSEDSGSQTLEGNVRGFNFLISCASEINLKSVNCSWGANPGVVEFIYTLLVNELGRQGVITVFASGNNGLDLDQKIETASFIDSPYLLSVDSMNPAGNRSNFSNYGKTQTDVFAPGSDILSTVPATVVSSDPAGDPVYSNYNRYHPESDQGVINRIKFSEENIGDLVKVFEKNPLKGATSVGYDIENSGTDDKASMKIDRSHFKNPELDDKDNTWSPGDSVFLMVKAGDNVKASDIKLITARIAVDWGLYSEIGFLYGFAAQSNEGSIRMATMGKAERAKTESAQARGNAGAWGTATLAVDDLLQENEHIYVDNEGCIYLWLGVNEQRADDEKPDEILVDDITIGNSEAHAGAHIVFSGTSMAAPAVTAALGIVAKDEAPNSSFKPGDGKGSLGMQALKRSARLRAATQYENHLEDACATGGFVRLTSFESGSTEDKPLAPIIASCGQTGDKSKDIEVNGWFFGASKNDPKITVDGKAAEIKSWSEEKMIISLPEGVGNGAHILRIQTAAGIDKAPFSSNDEDTSVSTALYEYELSVPDAFTANPDGNDGKFFPCMASSGDCIYTLQKDLSSNIIAVWKYHIPSGTWEMIEKPSKANMYANPGSSIADTPEGIVFAAQEQIGTDKSGMPVMEDYLYYYDAGTGRWTRKDLPGEYLAGTTIFSRGEDLYFAGISRELTIEGKRCFSVLEVLRKGETKTESLGHISTDYKHSSYFSGALIADCGGYVYLLGQEPLGGYYPFSYGLIRLKLDENEKVTEVREFSEELADAGIIKKDVWDSTVGLASIGCGVAIINRETEGTDTIILENGKDKFEEYERTSSFYHGNSQMAVSNGRYLYVMGYSPSEPGKMFFRATELHIEHNWDEGKVTREPTLERPGEFTYTCTRCGLRHIEEIPYDGWEYRCIYGDGSEWIMGSKDPLVFRFERLPEDESYERYERILIDGKEPAGSGFDIEKGSLVVKLKAPYLETLSDGKHIITAEFNDGSADASFTVTGNGSRKVKTGDDRNLGAWLILLIVSAAALGTFAAMRRKA